MPRSGSEFKDLEIQLRLNTHLEAASEFPCPSPWRKTILFNRMIHRALADHWYEEQYLVFTIIFILA